MPIRKNLSVSRDPYLPWGGSRKIAACKRCGAIYRHKRWSLQNSAALFRGGPIRSVVCPACRKISDGFPSGIVTLRGEFLKKHKDQILQRARNEETRAVRVNPLERIISIKNQGDSVEIKTTSERFAQRIGREIQRAFKGRTTYRWGGEDKMIRVDWHRGS